MGMELWWRGRVVEHSFDAAVRLQNGSCERGDSCPYAHGVFECWLHPARYRTQVRWEAHCGKWLFVVWCTNYLSMCHLHCHVCSIFFGMPSSSLCFYLSSIVLVVIRVQGDLCLLSANVYLVKYLSISVLCSGCVFNTANRSCFGLNPVYT
jgi:Zinc finger C-x8-C-x5-C-x3-H type (and similar)